MELGLLSSLANSFKLCIPTAAALPDGWANPEPEAVSEL
jgi:hypothetical protein